MPPRRPRHADPTILPLTSRPLGPDATRAQPASAADCLREPRGDDNRARVVPLRPRESATMAVTPTEFARQLEREGFAPAEELDVLLPAVYADLKRIAHRQLLRHVPGATLSTTVLVHETWARLAAHGRGRFTRAHLLSLGARVMRQVVVDHARARCAAKRGGGLHHVELEADDARDDAQGQALLLLGEALDALAEADPRLLRLVEQHWFIGLEPDELALLHEVSLRTIQRELKRARAWLAELLSA